MDDEDLAPAERAKLISRYGKSFLAGETIFREGEPSTSAFLLQEGRVRLLKKVRSTERSVMVLSPGELFGESALLDSAARSSTAVGLTDGVCLALDRETFRSLVAHHSSVASRMTEQLIRRVRDAEDQIEILLLRDAQYKIVAALIKLAGRTETTTSGEHIVAQLNLSPVELASRVGLDIDTVKRNVQRLREQGYLRINAEQLEIPDLETLRRLFVLLGTKDELKGEPRA